SGPVPRFLPIDRVQAAPLQLRRVAERRADRSCGGDGGADIPGGLPYPLIALACMSTAGRKGRRSDMRGRPSLSHRRPAYRCARAGYLLLRTVNDQHQITGAVLASPESRFVANSGRNNEFSFPASPIKHSRYNVARDKRPVLKTEGSL